MGRFMKYLFLSLLMLVFFSACDPGEPDSFRRRPIKQHSSGSDTPNNQEEETVLQFTPPESSAEKKDDNSGILNGDKLLSLEEAEKRAALSRMCEFKEDHILNEEEKVAFFKEDIIIKGSEKPVPVKEIIKKRERTGWDFFLDWLPDFKMMNSGENQIAFDNSELIVPYKYDKDEKYGNWCPEEGECIVRVIYRGLITSNENSAEPSENSSKKTPLMSWQVTGDLMAQVQFAGKFLDFSECGNVE